MCKEDFDSKLCPPPCRVLVTESAETSIFIKVSVSAINFVDKIKWKDYQDITE